MYMFIINLSDYIIKLQYPTILTLKIDNESCLWKIIIFRDNSLFLEYKNIISLFFIFYNFSHFGRHFAIISVEKLYEYAFFFKKKEFLCK